jgi:hypothetical protein
MPDTSDPSGVPGGLGSDFFNGGGDVGTQLPPATNGSAPTSLGIIGGGDVSSGSPLGIFGTLGGNTGGLGGQIGNALGGGAGGGGGGPGGTLGGLLGGSGNVGSGSPLGNFGALGGNTSGLGTGGGNQGTNGGPGAPIVVTDVTSAGTSPVSQFKVVLATSRRVLRQRAMTSKRPARRQTQR